MLQIHGKNEGKMLQGLENLIYEIDLSNRYFPVTIRRLILSFCLAKGVCSLLNHFLTQQNSKCFTAA